MGGRLALVTGASRGIGFEIAGALARQGCDLVMTARDGSALARAAGKIEKLGARVLAQSSDVRDPASVDYLFALVRGLRRPLDFLINNAGVGQPNRSVGDLPYPMWQEVIDTNLTGMFLMTQAGLVVMKRGSAIVNNLSVAAERVWPGSAAYNASKHGALGFTDTLRDELRGKGIRVIGLMPGATDTGIWNTIWPKAPRRKMMSAATVAQAVVNALLLPENSTVEKLVIMPSGGPL
ncbi:MAG: SDR family oxidoreductase [Terriglobales bacterium]